MAINEASKHWEIFCDKIKETGLTVLSSSQQLDSVNQADGLRYLTRLLKGSFDKYIEFSDPEDPHFFKMCDERSGYGGDNPDNIYTASAIHSDHTYEIIANKGSVWQFNFSVFNWKTNSQYELLGYLPDTSIETDDKGNFSLILGGKPQDKNWLPLPKNANQIMLRQTFCNRNIEKEISIKIRIISPIRPEKKIDLPLLSEKLSNAGEFFNKTGLMMNNWSINFFQHPNTLPLTDPEFISKGGGDPSAFFYISSWIIKPHQALLITIRDFPEDHLWNFALFNYWFESMDYINHQIHTNSKICTPNSDGSVTLVIAHTNPNTPNWLDTTGHLCGHMIMRAWTDGLIPNSPKVKLVQLDNLSHYLN